MHIIKIDLFVKHHSNFESVIALKVFWAGVVAVNCNFGSFDYPKFPCTKIVT